MGACPCAGDAQGAGKHYLFSKPDLLYPWVKVIFGVGQFSALTPSDGGVFAMEAVPFLSLVLFLGLFLKAFGFLVRDELALRALVLVGMSCDIVFYALQPVPIWQSVISNALLATINLGLILLIVWERTTIRMSTRDKALFDHFPTLQPGQFRRMMRHATWHKTEGETQIATEGAALDQLYFIDAPSFDIEKQGRRFTAIGPAFAGELAFLGGGASSASVFVPAGHVYVAFDSAGLHRAMARSGPLNNAMVALFGKDLARKVANSVPMERAPNLQPVPEPVAAAVGEGALIQKL